MNDSASEMRSLREHNAVEVLQRLTPIVRGWATYYRTVVSSKVVLLAGQLHVAAHLQVGQAHPPEEIEALDRQPVLRQVEQLQA